MASSMVRWPKVETQFISHWSIAAQKVGSGIKYGTLAENLDLLFYILTSNNDISC